MQSNECTRNCWIGAAVIGLLVWIFASFIGETSVMGGLFLGLIAGVLMGLFLVWALCRGAGSPQDVQAQQFVADARASAPPAMPSAASGAAAAVSSPPSGAKEDEIRRQAAKAERQAIRDDAAAAPAEDRPAKADAEPAKDATPKAAPKPKAAKSDKAKTPAKAKAKDDAKPKADKPATRKAATKSGGKAETTKAKAKAKPAAKAKPDDLKQIKGIGPKMEKLLNQNGVTRFDQIAGWTDAMIDEFAEKIGNMGGRIRSDDWVAQAKTLAAGGSTEFSQRVDKGDVY